MQDLENPRCPPSSAPTIRLDINTTQECILCLSSSKKKERETLAFEGEEEDSPIMKKPHSRKQIVLERR